MTLEPQKRRSPAQVRAGNRRIAFILIGIVAAFFLGAVVKQWLSR
ncbi:cytochrome oxidase small assembly protein [Trinickia sp. LjRoot230]